MKASDGREVSIEIDGNKVNVDGAEATTGNAHNDVVENFSPFPNNNDEGADEDDVEREETVVEAFINDARYGLLKDVRNTLFDGTICEDDEDRTYLVNARHPEFGHTALMMACSNNHVGLVELLLTVPGLEICSQNKSGNTALHWAALMGRKRIVQMLLLENAEEDPSDLSSSVVANFSSNKRVRQKADANIFNNANQKPFDLAFAKKYSGVCEVIAKYTNFEYCTPEPPEDAEKHRLK